MLPLLHSSLSARAVSRCDRSLARAQLSQSTQCSAAALVERALVVGSTLGCFIAPHAASICPLQSLWRSSRVRPLQSAGVPCVTARLACARAGRMCLVCVAAARRGRVARNLAAHRWSPTSVAAMGAGCVHRSRSRHVAVRRRWARTCLLCRSRTTQTVVAAAATPPVAAASLGSTRAGLGFVTRRRAPLFRHWQPPLARSPAQMRTPLSLPECDLPSPLGSLPQPHD